VLICPLDILCDCAGLFSNNSDSSNNKYILYDAVREQFVIERFLD